MCCFLTLAFSAKAQSRLLIFCKCVCQAKFPVSKLLFLLKALDRLKITHKRLKRAISLSRGREGECIRHLKKVRSVQKYHFIYCSCRIRWNRISFSVLLLSYALKKTLACVAICWLAGPFIYGLTKHRSTKLPHKSWQKVSFILSGIDSNGQNPGQKFTLVLGLGFQVLHSCRLYECR